ncbi:MAG: hypothetical protein ABI781_15410, partial [Burkholderiales bacterium]
LKASAGIRMTHIPYTGAGPAIVALLSSRVDALATGPSTMVRQIVSKAGSPIEYLDAPEFQSYWDADAALMVRAVRGIGKLK